MTFTLESLATLAAVLAPLVGVPLSAITLYLRSLRENVVESHAGVVRRLELLEAWAVELRKAVSELPRDYATKEEWLRELLHTRRVLEQVTESTIRIEVRLDEIRGGTKRSSNERSEQESHDVRSESERSIGWSRDESEMSDSNGREE